jgi:hypothetical protein
MTHKNNYLQTLSGNMEGEGCMYKGRYRGIEGGLPPPTLLRKVRSLAFIVNKLGSFRENASVESTTWGLSWRGFKRTGVTVYDCGPAFNDAPPI